MNATVDVKYRQGDYGCLWGRQAEGRTDRGLSGVGTSGKVVSGEGSFADKITFVLEKEEELAEGSFPAEGTAGPGAAGETTARGNAGAAPEMSAAVSPRDMSLEEYAQYIYGQISELSRRNYSRGNSVFIYISEEGFRAMQNDPEYEAWVMENVRQAYYYAGNRGGHDGYHSAHFFGATKEEYRGQSWSSGCSKCEQERRRELKLRRKKQLQELLKKRQAQKLAEKQRLEKLYQEKRRLEKSVYRKLLVKKESERERLEEEHREEALARREAASAFRMYMALLKYNEQYI